MGVCNCSMFCCTLLYVHYSIAIILMGKRELVALLCLSSWCLVIVVWFFLAVPWGCLQFVIVVFPDHTHYFLDYMRQRVDFLAQWLEHWSCTGVARVQFLAREREYFQLCFTLVMAIMWFSCRKRYLDKT